MIGNKNVNSRGTHSEKPKSIEYKRDTIAIRKRAVAALQGLAALRIALVRKLEEVSEDDALVSS